MLSTSPWLRFELTTSVVIGTDCIGSCKSNYRTITATTPPLLEGGHVLDYLCNLYYFQDFFPRGVKKSRLCLSSFIYVFQIPLFFNYFLCLRNFHIPYERPSWSYVSWMQNYLCNQCLSPLSVWVRISLMVYSIQHYVIKFVRYLRQVGGFLRVLRFPPPIKLLDCHDVTDILLKVALNTLTHNKKDEHAPKIHLRSDI